jgi:hypothetical protein
MIEHDINEEWLSTIANKKCVSTIAKWLSSV